jgi:hypothetical protein
LQGISCAAKGYCAAIGTYSDASGNDHGWLERLSGSTWTGSTAPTIGLRPAAGKSSSFSLANVSCPSRGWCVAAGTYQEPSDISYPLVETLSGGTWTAATVSTEGLYPAAVGAMTVFDLTCAAQGSCVAVGQYEGSSRSFWGLIETLSRGTWTATTAPMTGLRPPTANGPPNGGAGLNAVSCPTRISCVAIGSYGDTSGMTQGLIERLSGGRWEAATAPTIGLRPAVGKNPSVYLSSVSCPAPGFCVAAGSYLVGASRRTQRGLAVEGLFEVFSNGTWRASTAPLNGLRSATATTYTTPSVNFTGLSCPAVGSCGAVETVEPPSYASQSLLDTLSGRTWTATTAATIGLSASEVGLEGVSCPKTGSCVAVGYVSSSAVYPLVETEQ